MGSCQKAHEGSLRGRQGRFHKRPPGLLLRIPRNPRFDIRSASRESERPSIYFKSKTETDYSATLRLECILENYRARQSTQSPVHCLALR
jgi:hypothetical protein